jgi:hypothetical protein
MGRWPKMDKYEYIAKEIIHAGLLNPTANVKKVTEELNKLGDEGWELVSTLTAGNADRGIYLFKRKVR